VIEKELDRLHTSSSRGFMKRLPLILVADTNPIWMSLEQSSHAVEISSHRGKMELRLFGSKGLRGQRRAQRLGGNRMISHQQIILFLLRDLLL
jgi:hypothetical protein